MGSEKWCKWQEIVRKCFIDLTLNVAIQSILLEMHGIEIFKISLCTLNTMWMSHYCKRKKKLFILIQKLRKWRNQQCYYYWDLKYIPLLFSLDCSGRLHRIKSTLFNMNANESSSAVTNFMVFLEFYMIFDHFFTCMDTKAECQIKAHNSAGLAMHLFVLMKRNAFRHFEFVRCVIHQSGIRFMFLKIENIRFLVAATQWAVGVKRVEYSTLKVPHNQIFILFFLSLQQFINWIERITSLNID